MPYKYTLHYVTNLFLSLLQKKPFSKVRVSEKRAYHLKSDVVSGMHLMRFCVSSVGFVKVGDFERKLARFPQLQASYGSARTLSAWHVKRARIEFVGLHIWKRRLVAH
jgi:hypothetical protein